MRLQSDREPADAAEAIDYIGGTCLDFHKVRGSPGMSQNICLAIWW